MQTSATASVSTTILGFFMTISLTVLISLTPSWKVLMISMSRMYGIAFLALQKHFTYTRRLSSGFYMTVFRVSVVEERSYVPWKFTMNMTYS
jgi:hypothetical protein